MRDKAGQLGQSEASGPHTHAKMHGHPHMHMDMCTYMDAHRHGHAHTHRCCLPSTTAIRSRHHHYTVPASEGDIGQDMACPRPPRSRGVRGTGNNNGMGRNAENKGRSPQRSRRKHCQSCQSLTRSGVGGGRRPSQQLRKIKGTQRRSDTLQSETSLTVKTWTKKC